jgi:arabinofuranosyltransferase
MPKNKILIFTCLLAYFAIINFLRNNYLYTTILDDAYIFFRYAENIFSGFGFVWNINEPPVEGYTSFLYLVTLLTAKYLSIDLELFAILLGTLSSALTLYFAYLIYEFLYSKVLTHRWVNIVTIVILTLSPAYIYWSPAGMETSFYSIFLLLTMYSFLKLSDKKDIDGSNKNHSALILFNGILFGLLCVLRFEAVLFFLAAFFFLIKEENSLVRIKINSIAVLFVLGFIIIFGTYFVWRWSYFGYFFPNTYYAKTGGGLQQIAGGFLYTVKALRLFYGFGWIPIFIIMFFFEKRMIKEKAVFLFSIAAISILTTIFIGGDHFHLGRFVLPVLPLIFVFFPPALDRFLSIKSLKLKANYKATIILVILVLLLVYKPVYLESFKGFQNILDGRKETLVVYDESTEKDIIEWQHAFILMGETLKQIAAKDDYIAVVPIGAIGYISKINVIDMVGLVDAVIAHEQFSPDAVHKWTPGHTKGDGKYILSRKPKYIQLTDYLTQKPLETPHERSTQFVSVKELWELEEFHNEYEFYPIEVIDGWYYNLFRRKHQ